MAITIDDFSKIWASTSPLTPYAFSDDNYKQGWNFVGSTPPSRQMWDFIQKNNDEKLKYLLDNFDDYLPLAGGTMTGAIKGNPITLTADDGLGNEVSLVGNPDGTLIWNNKNVAMNDVVEINNLSSIIDSYGSGYSLRGGSAIIIGGRIVSLRIGINIANAVSANTIMTGMFILKTGYRPINDVFIGSQSQIGTLESNGGADIRTLINIGANSWVWVNAMFLI